MIRQPVLYAILLVFPLFGASAQEPGLPVSFEQAVEMVNRDNKSIRIAEQGLDWAKSERQRLNSFWYPRISASGAYVHMANDIEVKESLSAFTDPVKDFIHSIDPGEQIITSLLNNLGSHSFSVPLAPGTSLQSTRQSRFRSLRAASASTPAESGNPWSAQPR